MVQHARMFAHKPDGQVIIVNLRDAKGVPVVPMQDPLHYPYGTNYLMPGRRCSCCRVLFSTHTLELAEAAQRAPGSHNIIRGSACLSHCFSTCWPATLDDQQPSASSAAPQAWRVCLAHVWSGPVTAPSRPARCRGVWQTRSGTSQLRHEQWQAR